MTTIVATIVIAISYILFTKQFKGIFYGLFLLSKFFLSKISSTKKDDIFTSFGGVLITPIITEVLVKTVFVTLLLSGLYFLFIKYDFGYSVSAFVGAGIAIVFSLWQTIKVIYFSKK
jgi:hypothetical protein